ncbi:MAG: tRNA (cytidine(34)-2'-O)-methyltransferase [Lentisphaerae bacterium ADurb.Bin242]|nr:MAG: tRNA (cytidine(34)-2'-O)-methyltransferase [Lentisphaerae bacterium ADurb.Bin242]
MNPLFNVVLVAPEIPQNTGNIGRICSCTGCRLHLVKPIAFSLDDRHVRRSGMDYWKHVDFIVHESWEDFLKKESPAHMYFYSTQARKVYWDCPMEDGSYLVFGSEGSGLPRPIHDRYGEFFYTIPMPGQFSRSLNLANSAAVAIYEGLRRRRPDTPGENS